MVRTILRVLLFLWELPQNLLGLLLLAVLQVSGKTGRLLSGRNRVWIPAPISVSLGLFIFWTPPAEPAAADRIKEHEYGHSLQSRLLGPLYLIIVGLPSFSGALYALWYERRYHEHWDRYFDRFPEDWADRLGKIR